MASAKAHVGMRWGIVETDKLGSREVSDVTFSMDDEGKAQAEFNVDFGRRYGKAGLEYEIVRVRQTVEVIDG